jgi:hypothetical protein
VTLGLVEAGEIIGTPFRWHSGAAASDRELATSPSTATTWFCLISLRTAVFASSGLD